MEKYFENYGEKLKPFICDTSTYLYEQASLGKSILFEAQLGALRDIDFGIYPYTTSSNTIASYAPIGAGVPSLPINKIIGVVKAYSTCVGEGPFVCEMFGEEAETLRETGHEYGAKTGRPRRVGPIDILATRYGVQVQGATEIALTKLDVLSFMDKIPVCVAYELDGKEINTFPFPVELNKAKPIIKLIITTYRLKNGNNYLRSYCSCGTLGGRRSDNGNQQIAGEIASKQHNRGGKTRS